MTEFEEIIISSSFSELKAPFTTALRTVSNLELFEFAIRTADGRIGKGECVETPAITGDTKNQILYDLNETLTIFLKERTYTSYRDIAPELASASATSSAKAAVDMALYNLEYPTIPSDLRVGSDVTVPIASLDELRPLIATRIKDGFSTFKIKLGLEDIDLSIAKLKRIRDLIGPEGGIRVDPNQSWSLAHTLEFLGAIEEENIVVDFLEQPTPAGEKESLAVIRQRSNIKVMADESCFDMKDLLELIDLNAVDLINIKLLKSGGLYSGFEMAKVAAGAGIGVFVGSMMEGDIGVSNAIRLAHEISPLEVHDLDAAWWAKHSVLHYVNGTVVL